MEQEKKINGTLLGTTIIIIILIAGGIYTWKSKAQELIRQKAAQQQSIEANQEELNKLDQELNADVSGGASFDEIN